MRNCEAIQCVERHQAVFFLWLLGNVLKLQSRSERVKVKQVHELQKSNVAFWVEQS